MIPLTKEQQEAVDHPDTLCLTSCPGSGKTRAIIAKLLRCLNDVRGTPRKIACITFTNTGVNEIEARLRTYGDGDDADLCEIATIHSFCLNYVVRPFAHLIPHLQNDWCVVTSEDEWFKYLVKELIAKYKIKSTLAEKFDGFQRLFPDILPTVSGIPPEAVKEFFQRADAEGKVTLGDIVYFAAKIVLENEFIASALASRFAWYIVDEFQDTTQAQAALLLEVFRQGRSKIFFVGDPNQSILSFAGATPELMHEFAKQGGARMDVRLTGNFRSSKLVVDHAELLCPTAPPMVAVGENKDVTIPPRYVQCKTPIEGIFDHFIPAIDAAGIKLGDAAVLAPWWTDLFFLGRELRKREIPIIGPGSRPYKRSHEFTILSEALSAYLVAPDADAAAALQKALFITLSNIAEVRPHEIYRVNGRRIIFRLIYEAEKVLAGNEAITPWLLKTADGCEKILIDEELLPREAAGVFTNSAAAMIADMVKNEIDVVNMPAAELGMIAVPKNCINLITLHQSKGREFDAVAVIKVHDDRIPHFSSKLQREIDESRRLLYVAATRARKLLMYFCDQTDSRNKPSRFLGKNFLGMC